MPEEKIQIKTNTNSHGGFLGYAWPRAMALTRQDDPENVPWTDEGRRRVLDEKKMEILSLPCTKDTARDLGRLFLHARSLFLESVKKDNDPELMSERSLAPLFNDAMWDIADRHPDIEVRRTAMSLITAEAPSHVWKNARRMRKIAEDREQPLALRRQALEWMYNLVINVRHGSGKDYLKAVWDLMTGYVDSEDFDLAQEAWNILASENGRRFFDYPFEAGALEKGVYDDFIAYPGRRARFQTAANYAGPELAAS